MPRAACFSFLLLLGLTSAARAASGDAPEISRSAGVKGGVVLLWPRIIPSSEAQSSREVADLVQRRLEALLRRALPGRPIDVRPEPERVCRRAGCDAASVGVLLVRKGPGCVLVGLLSGPGPVAAQLSPWVGEVALKQPLVPFREPPEAQVTITDFAVCADLLAGLTAKEEVVLAALRGLAP